MSAHTPGCVWDHNAKRWTARGKGCCDPQAHGDCVECNGRGWQRAIRDHRRGDDDPVNRLPCRICDGRGKESSRG